MYGLATKGRSGFTRLLKIKCRQGFEKEFIILGLAPILLVLSALTYLVSVVRDGNFLQLFN